MWGVPTSLKGFFPGDDMQDPDCYVLVLSPAGPTPADMLWQNTGSTGPVTPTNFTAKIVNFMAASAAASGQEIKVFAQNVVAATSAQTLIGVFALGVQGAVQVSTENFRLLAPPNTKFQVSAAISADVVALARYVKGAGL